MQEYDNSMIPQPNSNIIQVNQPLNPQNPGYELNPIVSNN